MERAVVNHEAVNALAAKGFLSAADIAMAEGSTPGYIRKRACVERWQRVRHAGRTYYRLPPVTTI